MQLTIVLPDEIGERVRRLPDPDSFIAELLERALKPEKCRNMVVMPGSKWARIAQRVDKDPVHLDGCSRQLKRDMKEFRESFQFDHDR